MKSSVFIGSSKESLPVVDAIAKGLEKDATVVCWNDRKTFPPGEFILNSLLKQVQKFDFAVMVFGPDDVVISRRQKLNAPRDNVVFELGLFMSRLEHHRALVVAPEGSSSRIKILSDLAGLKPVVYTPPKRRRDRAALTRALSEAIEQIRGKIKEIGPKLTAEVPPYQGPRDVLDAASVITELLKTPKVHHQPATVLNIALDMEVTWRIIADRLLENPQVKNASWRSLMINPDSPAIKVAASESVSLKTASEKIGQIRQTCFKLKDQLAARNVNFECRAYGSVPVIHGFLVNGTVLLLTMTRIQGGKLIGAPNAYWRFVWKQDHEATVHLFNAYSEWFEHAWADGEKIWPQ